MIEAVAPDWDLVEHAVRGSLLRFSTAGSVDDGKSTLIGRLLHDTGNIYEDHLDALRKKSEKVDGAGKLSLALLTDGLKAEQEQGITIDVAYRYFSTAKRWFILADSPGHEQYTRNMATGASTADLTIILVDARKGVVTQTRRHAFIASLLGVPRLLVTVNKMDLVDYSQQTFDQIREDFTDFAAKIGIREVRFIPVVALHGDNVVETSTNMPWYHGETVMEYLEGVYIAGDRNHVDFRFPVQYVLRPHQNYRGFAGQISSGHIRVGEEVMVLPSMKKSRIRSIDVDSRDPRKRQLELAYAPMSVVLSLDDEIDVSRGDMLVRAMNVPPLKTQFEAMVVWLAEEDMNVKKQYAVVHTTRDSKVFIDEVKYRIDVNTLQRTASHGLQLNEVGRVSFTSTRPLFLDSYQSNRATGNFILIDLDTNLTVAAGMVIDRLPSELLTPAAESSDLKKPKASQALHAEASLIAQKEREDKFGFGALTVWCTGLSGAGKSSIAKSLERRVFDLGRPVFRLDGDNLRFGLNRDLGFSNDDRQENIRRVAEVARLFNQAGITVVCSFISPFQRDRDMAREIIGKKHFVEVFVDTPLDVCESRDPHGLYKRARAGELKEFTGVSGPYEKPKVPDIRLDTSKDSLDRCVEQVLEVLAQRDKKRS